MLKIEDNLDVNLFASAVRLRKILEKKGLTEQKIESFIENIDIHSFRHGITFQGFTNAVDKVCALSDQFRIQLDQLPQHITEQEKKLQMLRIEVRDIIQKKNKALQDYDQARRDLKEYNKIKTQIQSHKLIEKQLHDCRSQLMSEMTSRKVDRYIDQRDLNALNQYLKTPITAQQLITYVRYSPIKNIDIIKMMQQRAFQIFEEFAN
jgi:arsenate reductase-like glutaredoxin family protein